MQKKKDGAMYAPKGRSKPVCAPGDFPVGVIGLDHGHIYGMCNGLTEAGAEITLVYDSDPAKVAQFQQAFPSAKAAASKDEVYASNVKMIASASIPLDRGPLGVEAMRHGKDFFVDKPPLITLEHLEQVRQTVRETGQKFFCYFSERLHVEGSVYAQQLLEQGKIGKVVQVMGWGPHRMGPESSRPDWFFEKDVYGGILTDIGCHQIEQIIFFSGAKDARIVHSRAGNYNHPGRPGLEDFGDCMIECDNGVTGYFRVDWFTPKGLGAWGDGRTIIEGTDGYIEIRKYIDIANNAEGDQVYYVDHEGEHHCCASGKCGFPFFGGIIRDCLDHTELVMKQDYIFRVIELAIQAEREAEKVGFKR